MKGEQVMYEQKKEIEIEQSYEISTNYGVIRRMLVGVLMYFWYAIMGKKLVFTIKKKYKNENVHNTDKRAGDEAL